MSDTRVRMRTCHRCNRIFYTTTKSSKAICPNCVKSNKLGFKTCPKWLKKKYLEAVKFKCQICGSEENLEIHRITRGNAGGLYTLRPLNHKENNIKVVCNKCHKKLHPKEWR